MVTLDIKSFWDLVSNLTSYFPGSLPPPSDPPAVPKLSCFSVPLNTQLLQPHSFLFILYQIYVSF